LFPLFQNKLPEVTMPIMADGITQILQNQTDLRHQIEQSTHNGEIGQSLPTDTNESEIDVDLFFKSLFN